MARGDKGQPKRDIGFSIHERTLKRYRRENGDEEKQPVTLKEQLEALRKKRREKAKPTEVKKEEPRFIPLAKDYYNKNGKRTV
jgi:hypothetical protein